jgi:serine protease SohB
VTDWLAEYGMFLAQALTVVGAVLVVVAGVALAGQRLRPPDGGQIEVRRLNERYDAMRDALRSASLDPKAYRKLRKREAKEKTRAAKAAGEGAEASRAFVLDFDGDLRAGAVDALREEVSAVLTMARSEDTVMLRLESPGGVVHGYGLAAAQLERLRSRGMRLVVCVDKVAASGGYMMACVASEVVAAPFAVLGSIGVLAQLPNLHRLLRKHDIDYEVITAGQFKRTLTLFGRNTDEGRRKFREELEDIHALFKEHVGRWRPALDLEQVATGESWYGSRALALGLVDRLGTSDQWLQDAADAGTVLLEVSYTERKRLGDRVGELLESAVSRGVGRALDELRSQDDTRVL